MKKSIKNPELYSLIFNDNKNKLETEIKKFNKTDNFLDKLKKFFKKS